MSNGVLSFPPQGKSLLTKHSLHCLVFFVPGNPGLVDFYEPFLSALRRRLDQPREGVVFHLVGYSLAGFQDDDHEPFTATDPPFDLAHQIRVTYDRVSVLRVAHGPSQGEPFDAVLLVGRMRPHFRRFLLFDY